MPNRSTAYQSSRSYFTPAPASPARSPKRRWTPRRSCASCRRAPCRRISSRTTHQRGLCCSSGFRATRCRNRRSTTRQQLHPHAGNDRARGRRAAAFRRQDPSDHGPVRPRAMPAKGLAPIDVISSVNAQNLILPGGGGVAKIGTGSTTSRRTAARIRSKRSTLCRSRPSTAPWSMRGTSLT
jgi:hypothetical protein